MTMRSTGPAEVRITRQSRERNYEPLWIAHATITPDAFENESGGRTVPSPITESAEGETFDVALDVALDRLGRRLDRHPSTLRPSSVTVEPDPVDPPTT